MFKFYDVNQSQSKQNTFYYHIIMEPLWKFILALYTIDNYKPDELSNSILEESEA